MAELTNLIIGTVFLLLGFPIGNYLAKHTREELKVGQKWFKLICLLSIIGAFIGLFYGNDTLFFSFAFIALVTSRSLDK